LTAKKHTRESTSKEQELRATLENQDEEFEKSLNLHWNIYFVLYKEVCFIVVIFLYIGLG